MYLLFLSFLLCPLLTAQNNLQYYLNSAFRNNPTLKESQNNISVKKLDKSLTEAQYVLPQISLTANYLFVPYFNNDKIVTANPGPNAIGYDASVTNGGLYSAQVNVTKNIFNGGVIDAFNNQADLQIKSNEFNFDLSKHNLEKDVTDQYIICWQAQQLYILSAATADTLIQQLNITKNLMMKGLVKQSDYLLLKIEFETQQLAALQSLASLRSSIYQLNVLAGIQDSSIVTLDNLNLNKTSISGFSKFFSQYENDSLLILNQQDVFETKYYPQLNLFFNAGLNAVELNDIQRKFGLSAGFNFSIPIYDGSQKSITRQQSQINLNSIVSNKKNQEILIKNKITESSSQIDFYINSLQSITSQLGDYNKIMILMNSELMHGQLSMVDYITIIKNYLDLKKNEISSSAAYQQALNQFNYWNW
ncbi:MAG: TolC family protein [Ignavibacteriaceae bacterium]|nr:TolC family protein [Ignavibacteriaceae bacterium]